MCIEVTRYARLKERWMVSHNASEGVKPRNCSSLHWAKGFPAWKPAALHAITASVRATCRGRRPWRVIRGFTTELGRTISFPEEASNEPKRQRRKYGGMVVGLTRSRGVNEVMLIESPEPGTLEGVSSRTQRAEVAYAIH
jgi:hypothetical protein